MCRFNEWLSQILLCHTVLFVSICRSCSFFSSSWYVVHVELWHWHLRMGIQLSSMPEPPSVIQILHFLPNSGVHDTRIVKEFWIFAESPMLNNLQSISQENHYQDLDSPETDPVQYISNHPGIGGLSMWYRQLMYHILRYGLHILDLPKNTAKEVLGQKYSSYPPRIHSAVQFDGLRFYTAHIFNSKANFDMQPLILNILSYSRHASEQCIPTSHYCWKIHVATFKLYFLSSWILWICGCQDTGCLLSHTTHLHVAVTHPAWPQPQIWMIDWSVCEGHRLNAMSVVLCVNNSLDEGVHHTLTMDAQPGVTGYNT